MCHAISGRDICWVFMSLSARVYQIGQFGNWRALYSVVNLFTKYFALRQFGWAAARRMEKSLNMTLAAKRILSPIPLVVC